MSSINVCIEKAFFWLTILNSKYLTSDLEKKFLFYWLEFSRKDEWFSGSKKNQYGTVSLSSCVDLFSRVGNIFLLNDSPSTRLWDLNSFPPERIRNPCVIAADEDDIWCYAIFASILVGKWLRYCTKSFFFKIVSLENDTNLMINFVLFFAWRKLHNLRF